MGQIYAVPVRIVKKLTPTSVCFFALPVTSGPVEPYGNDVVSTPGEWSLERTAGPLPKVCRRQEVESLRNKLVSPVIHATATVELKPFDR